MLCDDILNQVGDRVIRVRMYSQCMQELVAVNNNLAVELHTQCVECGLTDMEHETLLSFDGDVERRDIVVAGREYSAFHVLSQKADMYQWGVDNYRGFSQLILTELGVLNEIDV